MIINRPRVDPVPARNKVEPGVFNKVFGEKFRRESGDVIGNFYLLGKNDVGHYQPLAGRFTQHADGSYLFITAKG